MQLFDRKLLKRIHILHLFVDLTVQKLRRKIIFALENQQETPCARDQIAAFLPELVYFPRPIYALPEFQQIKLVFIEFQELFPHTIFLFSRQKF